MPGGVGGADVAAGRWTERREIREGWVRGRGSSRDVFLKDCEKGRMGTGSSSEG